MAAWKPLILDWLNEYSNLEENEIQSFAAEHEHNHEIATAIYALFFDESESSDISATNLEEDRKILEDVCMQLFSFYRSKEVLLRRFTLQFVPPLMYTYLSAAAKGTSKDCRCIETLLIGIYNFEVVDEDGKPKIVSFRLPSLAQASVYHEPLTLGPQFLTESALRRWEECNTKLVKWGPLPQVEAINTQNRLKVMTALLFVFNQQLSLLPKLALRHLCMAASRVVTHGFGKKKDGVSTNVPRIPVSSHLLLEFVQGAYFAMFNEFYTLAYQLVKDVDRRANYELFSEVMLVTSAVMNSLQTNLSGQPCDGSMGISLALSPATTTTTMSKSMITNASFRTKKLPEDIPIQVGQVVPTESLDVLTSITEEGETDTAPIQRGSNARGSKPKLSSFAVLGKKNKDKVGGASEKKVILKESKLIRNSIGSGDMVDSASPVPQKKIVEMMDSNGGIKDDRMSMTSDSLQNNIDNSDSRSQVTTDSLDAETVPRMPSMQVSSV